MKWLLVLPLLLLAAVSQAQDTTAPPPPAQAGSGGIEGGPAGGGPAEPLGPGIHREHTGSIPIASADSFDVPEFRGIEPGQPRRVFHLVLSQWLTNCYVLVGPNNGAIVIDPTDWLVPLPNKGWDVGGTDGSGHDIASLLDLIHKEHLKVHYVISTHGHLDHVSGLIAIKKAFPCIFCMYPADIDADGRPKDSHMFPHGLPKVDHPLRDGEIISYDGIKLKVMYTPGHSPGSISLLCGNWVFSGDTLFYRTVGRTNFTDGSGNWEQEINSIRTRLYTLPPATLVLPGHSVFTTIGDEKANNPWTLDAPPDTHG